LCRFRWDFGQLEEAAASAISKALKELKPADIADGEIETLRKIERTLADVASGRDVMCT
jgi:hypothetical protein